MKRFIYLLLFIAFTGTVITSCTEENVEPKREESGGGYPIADPLKP